jgi:hypothetical protein
MARDRARGGGFCEHGNESSGVVKGREFSVAI